MYPTLYPVHVKPLRSTPTTLPLGYFLRTAFAIDRHPSPRFSTSTPGSSFISCASAVSLAATDTLSPSFSSNHPAPIIHFTESSIHDIHFPCLFPLLGVRCNVATPSAASSVSVAIIAARRPFWLSVFCLEAFSWFSFPGLKRYGFPSARSSFSSSQDLIDPLSSRRWDLPCASGPLICAACPLALNSSRWHVVSVMSLFTCLRLEMSSATQPQTMSARGLPILLDCEFEQRSLFTCIFLICILPLFVFVALRNNSSTTFITSSVIFDIFTVCE